MLEIGIAEEDEPITTSSGAKLSNFANNSCLTDNISGALSWMYSTLLHKSSIVTFVFILFKLSSTFIVSSIVFNSSKKDVTLDSYVSKTSGYGS